MCFGLSISSYSSLKPAALLQYLMDPHKSQQVKRMILSAYNGVMGLAGFLALYHLDTVHHVLIIPRRRESSICKCVLEYVTVDIYRVSKLTMLGEGVYSDGEGPQHCVCTSAMTLVASMEQIRNRNCQ